MPDMFDLNMQLLRERDALLDRALTAEARVAQLEAALEANPLQSERLRAAIHEAAAKLAGRPHNAPQPVLEALIQLVLDDLCEAEDANDANPTPD